MKKSAEEELILLRQIHNFTVKRKAKLYLKNKVGIKWKEISKIPPSVAAYHLNQICSLAVGPY